MDKNQMIYRTEQNRTEDNSALFLFGCGLTYRTEYIRDG